jgi:hypothetical protein
LSFAGDRDRDIDRERERESIFRIRDRRRLDTTLRDEALKSLERDKADSLGADGSKKTGANQSQNPLVFGDDLQFWTERGPQVTNTSSQRTHRILVVF